MDLSFTQKVLKKKAINMGKKAIEQFKDISGIHISL